MLIIKKKKKKIICLITVIKEEKVLASQINKNSKIEDRGKIIFN
jgi:hypothetical protein